MRISIFLCKFSKFGNFKVLEIKVDYICSRFTLKEINLNNEFSMKSGFKNGSEFISVSRRFDQIAFGEGLFDCKNIVVLGTEMGDWNGDELGHWVFTGLKMVASFVLVKGVIKFAKAVIGKRDLVQVIDGRSSSTRKVISK